MPTAVPPAPSSRKKKPSSNSTLKLYAPASATRTKPPKCAVQLCSSASARASSKNGTRAAAPQSTEWASL
jgi:hypothetical protein